MYSERYIQEIEREEAETYETFMDDYDDYGQSNSVFVCLFFVYP